MGVFYITRILGTFIVFLILFFNLCFFNAVFAEKGINAYNIEITEGYITANGVCSCSLCTDRYHHHNYFKNYCPACKKRYTLCFEEGSAANNQCPEGMWYCTYCDTDYCLVHGKEHKDPTRNYLPYYTLDQKRECSLLIEYVNITLRGVNYKIEKNKVEELKKRIKDSGNGGIQSIIVTHPFS